MQVNAQASLGVQYEDEVELLWLSDIRLPRMSPVGREESGSVDVPRSGQPPGVVHLGAAT